MNNFKIDYDTNFDTLYVGIGDRSMSYGDDSRAGLILLRDATTDRITGFTVLSFLKRYRSDRLPILPPEIKCSIKNDIIPRINL